MAEQESQGHPGSTLRPHHYGFAHKLLPMLFFTQTEDFIDNLTRDKLVFLRWAWESFFVKVVKEESQRLPSTGLDCEVMELGDGTFVGLVELPEPKRMAEAIFVALVRLPEDATAGDDETPRERCLTLEHSYDLQQETVHTVLGEWEPNGTHRNYGTGPEPIREAFLEAVFAKIAETGDEPEEA